LSNHRKSIAWVKNMPDKYHCLDCAKDLAELKEAIINSDLENVRQRMQLKDEIAKLEDECEYVYGLLEDTNAEIKRLAERSQSRKKVLEEVGQPESNTHLRVPSSNVRNKENGH
jgi:hypothetical protein